MKFPIAVFCHSIGWQNKHLRIDFTEDYFLNSEYRICADMKYQRKLFELFSEIGLGKENPQPRPHIDCCGGILGKAIFGIPTTFNKDSPPDTFPMNINEQAMREFRLVPDFAERFPMKNIRIQVEQMQKQYGRVEPTYDLYHHGVVNLGLEIRGEEMMMDIVTKPQDLKDFLNRLGDGIMTVAEYTNTLMGKPPLYKLGHCSMCMFSPDFYRQFVMDIDVKLARKLRPFGIHHHGRTDNAHLDAYKELENRSRIPIEFFDLDWNVDVRYFRNLFPHAHLFYIMKYDFLADSNYAAFCQEIEGLLKRNNGNKTITFIAGDLDDGISKSNILSFAKAIHTVAGRNDFA
ncbi:MAG: hypothetical protein ABIG61_04485 [Planctomycetota bacterium]